MAQKTPVPALTIDTSGTWTSLWYYEFSELQTQWTANLQLHYVVNAYFAVKRRLMHNLTILQNNQNLLINAQLVAVEQLAVQKRTRKKVLKARSLVSPSGILLAKATQNNSPYSYLTTLWQKAKRQAFRRLSTRAYKVLTPGNGLLKANVSFQYAQLKQQWLKASLSKNFPRSFRRRFTAQRYCFRWLNHASGMVNNTNLPMAIRRRRCSLRRAQVWRSYRVTTPSSVSQKGTTTNRRFFTTSVGVVAEFNRMVTLGEKLKQRRSCRQGLHLVLAVSAKRTPQQLLALQAKKGGAKAMGLVLARNTTPRIKAVVSSNNIITKGGLNTELKYKVAVLKASNNSTHNNSSNILGSILLLNKPSFKATVFSTQIKKFSTVANRTTNNNSSGVNRKTSKVNKGNYLKGNNSKGGKTLKAVSLTDPIISAKGAAKKINGPIALTSVALAVQQKLNLATAQRQLTALQAGQIQRVLRAAQRLNAIKLQAQTAYNFKMLRRQKQLVYNTLAGLNTALVGVRTQRRAQPRLLQRRLTLLTVYNTPHSSPALKVATDLYYTSAISATKPVAVLEHQVKNVTPVLPRALYRRWRRDRQAFSRLRPRKNRPFMLAYRLLMARRWRSLVYKKRYARRFLKLSLLKAACQHIAGFNVNLTVRRYVCRTRFFKHLRHRAVFSRWSRQWYFLPTVVLVLASLMRGSAALLMAWLLRLLKSAKKHSALLYLISTAFKYFLYHPNTAHLVETLPCCGVRMEVVGKIDGQDRAQTFKVQVGAIPTSTLSAPLEVEYGACGTIYGVLGVWIWFFMKTQPLSSQTLLMRNNNYNLASTTKVKKF